MDRPQESPATEVGPQRWKSAVGWAGLFLVATVLGTRAAEHKAVILGLGVAVSAAVFVAALRERPAVVTRDEVRLPRRRIRRADVVRITRAADSTALVFRDAEDRIIGLADVFERHAELGDALTEHGWPAVERPD